MDGIRGVGVWVGGVRGLVWARWGERSVRVGMGTR